jgi:hypothetical protein
MLAPAAIRATAASFDIVSAPGRIETVLARRRNSAVANGHARDLV